LFQQPPRFVAASRRFRGISVSPRLLNRLHRAIERIARRHLAESQSTTEK
jgi:hypothetical protein